MIIGYARVSTKEQNLDRQLDQLKNAGALKIYKEKVTGTKKDRIELKKLLDYAREGDTILVTDLTRISRSTKDLINLIEQIKEKKINIKSLKESWLNTTTAHGKLMFTLVAGLSQFERDLISERTKEGLASARSRGKTGGRPPIKKEEIDNALMLYDLKRLDIKDICNMCGISKSTLYNYIKKRKNQLNERKEVCEERVNKVSVKEGDRKNRGIQVSL